MPVLSRYWFHNGFFQGPSTSSTSRTRTVAGRGSRTVRQVLGDKLALLAAFTFSTMYYLPGSGTASQGDHSSVPGIPADPVTGTPRRASGSGLSKRR